MKRTKSALTATHYAAASFAAAFFSLVAVLAVIGGTANGEAKPVDDSSTAVEPSALENVTDLDAPAFTDAQVAYEVPEAAETELLAAVPESDDEAVAPKERPMRRGPNRPIGPPRFDDIDGNGDGNITREEFDSFHATHRPPGPRGPERHARGDFGGPERPRGGEFDGPPRHRRGGPGQFDGPPRGPRGGHEFRGGPGGGPGHHGPPPHMRGGHGRGGHQQGPPPPHMRGGQDRGDHHQGPPPPRFRDGEGPRGPRAGGPGEFDRRPPRPDFSELDADGDGSISKQEFDDFRPPRGPRGDRGDFPREESF